MKIRAVLFSPATLALLAGLAAAVVWPGSASAQVAGTWNTAMVPILGTVKGVPENVVFLGQAQVDSKLAPDPDFNRPTLVLTIDLSGLYGVGLSTKNKYVIAGPERTQRGVAAAHLVEFTFPFAESGSTDLGSAQSGVASFALGFDVTTGAVTSASGRVNSAALPR
ncbi:MAG: hypothetical protein WA210_11055 [Burkholderiaceae bacterium]